MSLRARDVQIDVHRPGPKGNWTGCYMKLTHLPTGKVVQGDGESQVTLRRRLMAELEALVCQTGRL